MPLRSPPPHAPPAPLNAEKALLLTGGGALLWRSRAWSEIPAAAHKAIMGLGWHEFVYPPDLQRVKRWLRDEPEGALISFRCTTPVDSRWFRCWLVKLRFTPGAWYCIGDRVFDWPEPGKKEPRARRSAFSDR